MNEQNLSNEEPKIVGFESQPIDSGLSFEQTFNLTAIGVVLTLILFSAVAMICSERFPLPEIGGWKEISVPWAGDINSGFKHTPQRLDQYQFNSFRSKRKSIIDESIFQAGPRGD